MGIASCNFIDGTTEGFINLKNFYSPATRSGHYHPLIIIDFLINPSHFSVC